MKYLILLFVLAGCTDAEVSYFKSYGESQEILCYSGGKEIFKKQSTGKVVGLDGGGWAFRTTDGMYVQTFADCFVSYRE